MSISMLLAQAVPSVHTPTLFAVLSRLAAIVLAIAVLVPSRCDSTVTSMLFALSMSGAIPLIPELNSPFDGMIKITSHAMVGAPKQLSMGSPDG